MTRGTRRDHPKAIGDRSEAYILAALVDIYATVLMPWGENCRYDLVVETEEGQLLRVQCKTGHLQQGAVRFNTSSMTYHHPKYAGKGKAEFCTKGYDGQADLFGVYCVETGAVYLVPVQDVPGHSAALRVEPARNGQSVGIRWAAQYEVRRSSSVGKSS